MKGKLYYTDKSWIVKYQKEFPGILSLPIVETLPLETASCIFLDNNPSSVTGFLGNGEEVDFEIVKIVDESSINEFHNYAKLI